MRGASEVRFARVGLKAKRSDVVCGGTLNRALFPRRKLCLELVSNRLCDLAFNGEDIREIAIVSLRPKMRVIACIDQLRINAHAIGCALHAALEHMRHSKLFADFAQIAFYAALIMHHARAADHLQVGDLRQVSEYFVLHTIGEIGVLLLVAEVFERQYRDAFLGNRSTGWTSGSSGRRRSRLSRLHLL